MISGSLDSSTGRIYLYYHGPQRAILSDVSLQPKVMSEGVATGLRIVLFPNEWTELNFSDIREKWDTGTSQLNMLEKSGYLDIYTDPKEAAQVKELLKDFVIPEEHKHGGYIQELADKDVVKKFLEAKTLAPKAEDEFKMAQPAPKKYFELGQPMVGPQVEQDMHSGSTTIENESGKQLNKMVSLIEKQMEQSNKQAEQMTKMMETMQQVMLALASNLNKDK